MTRRQKPRRGVLLLIILSLLVLFVLIGVTFIVSAGHFRRTAGMEAKIEQHGDPPSKTLELAMHQILRGSADPYSVIVGHSLLEDLYGTDGFLGRVVSVNSGPRGPVAGPSGSDGQLIEIVFSAAGLSRPNHHYAGAVITMLSGPAAGRSSRIASFIAASPTATNNMLVESFEGIVPNRFDMFLVNGLPHNGTGAGYDPGPSGPTAGRLAAAQVVQDKAGTPQQLPIALMPNFSVYLNDSLMHPAFGGLPYTTSDILTLGGQDESWDAPDYQNMFMAKVPLAYTTPDNDILGRPASGQVTPSFHRPFLVHYWRNQPAGLWTDTTLVEAPDRFLTTELQRRVIMRPLRFAEKLDPNTGNWLPNTQAPINPSFTGSNTGFDPVRGPWDVDNDNDGVPDSVWLDFGLPPITADDGRLYKPLIAPLIIDLDGRLNVNAHGSLTHTIPAYGNPVQTGSQPLQLLRGSGFGPADVNLTSIFSNINDAGDVNEGYRRINLLRLLRSRYAGIGETADTAAPGLPTVDDGLAFNPANPQSSLKMPGLPNQSFVNFGLYGSAPDFHSRSAMFVDPTGNPIWDTANVSPLLDHVDDPYELNLDEPNSLDNPFTAADLEPILRRHDADALALRSRLRDPSLHFDPTLPLERLITTHSFDVRSPASVLIENLRLSGFSADPQASVSRLLEIRLRAGLASKGLTGPALETAVAAFLEQYLPFETKRGEPMDLNRRFGNGTPDPSPSDPYGVTDDPLEPTTAATELPGLPNDQEGLPTPGDNSVARVVDGTRLRQLYAKQLYVLMMALVDDGFEYHLQATEEATTPLPIRQRLHARRIAQWAMNVVEFRDSDAIMTPFLFDLNPFDGWEYKLTSNGFVIDNAANEFANSIPAARIREDGWVVPLVGQSQPIAGVVWGTEYPELIITESFAMHDRRVADESTDGKVVDQNDPDEDLDQVRMPQGSLFVELYCPRGPNGQNTAVQSRQPLPPELYTAINASGQYMLDVGRFSAGGSGRYPVWQIAIGSTEFPSEPDVKKPLNLDKLRQAKPDSATFDLYALQADTTSFDFKIDRYLWLAAPSNPASEPRVGVAMEGAGRTYWNHTPLARFVPPGGFAIVGPREVTHVGFQKDVDLGSKQTFELTPGIANAGGRFTYRDTQGTIIDPSTNGAGATNTAVTVIVADAPVTGRSYRIGCSVSEPIPADYYNKGTSVSGPDAKLIPPADEPFDENILDWGLDSGLPLSQPVEDEPGLVGTGTYSQYKTAFLQRLANPLLEWNPLPGHPRFDGSRPVNPYLTVDFLPIDLTVFNSEAELGATKDGKPIDKYDDGKVADIHLSSRQRAGQLRNLWSPDSERGEDRSPVAPSVTLRPQVDLNATHTLGQYNTKLPLDPSTPFPTLVWNNRPYASALELMLVPISSQDRLLHDYSRTLGLDPYGAGTGNAAVLSYYGPFRHLLNFFHSSTPLDPPAQRGANYVRIFDYVGVGSPFAGTETWFDTANSYNVPAFRPPFNRMSTFRDPGRINIDTLNEITWNALGGNYFVPYARLDATRRGFDASGPLNQRVQRQANFPDEYSFPFRSAAAADLMPSLMDPVLGKPMFAAQKTADATLLRADFQPVNQPPDRQPLLAPRLVHSGALQPDNRPSLRRDSNAYFKYQAYARLSELLTTRSNVYAVWLTVGYFELEPNYSPADTAYASPYYVDSAHPDGYRLGMEMGSDTGEVKRHRAFYIIDRSIPVGFERGVDHNVDNAVLLRRLIE